MYSFLLKKALPFTLTFVLGAALSALLGLFWGGKTGHDVLHIQRHVGEYGRGRRECRMRGRNLVAETKPLNIINVPAAYWPKGAHYDRAVLAVVTFGADGKVQQVEPVNEDIKDALAEMEPGHSITQTKIQPYIWEAAKRAAWQIQFEPETVDGRPVTVTRDVEIRFSNRAGQ